MTIRDRVIQTGNIALRAIRSASRNRARGYAPLRMPMQMTIRDRVIHTGNIALAGDLFRFAEPGA